MNENIKAACLELAKLALETHGVDINVSNYRIAVSHYSYRFGKLKTIYFDNISFIEKDAEQRIKKALDYVRSLGGNIDGR